MIDENTRKKSKKLNQIVETSEYLFKRFGIKRVTVEEICRKANVSKMTFYKYFPNKIELVKHLFNNWFDEGYSKLAKINAMNVSIAEKLRLMIEWKMGFLSEMSPEFIEEFVHVDSELMGFMQEYMQRSYKRFMEYFIGWQKNGDIRPGIRPELFIAVLDKLQELFGDDNLRKHYHDHIEFAHELHKLFFYGIVSRPDSEK
ncbi:MAG: TetR/AcrR family transcriptional regulator [Candidatus Latescibacteria bacterium]|jgi:AcrR family transcriptional regulator|nr:TetR/AcrR family transcriptional regulator [Candidatus Latescibacterota bacterium]